MDISALKNLGSYKLVPKVRILMLHCFYHFIIVAYEYIHIMNLKSMFIFFLGGWGEGGGVYVKIHFLKKFEIFGLVFEKIQSVRRLPFKRCKCTVFPSGSFGH